MATRNDLTVEYNESPRIVEVAQPSTELTMQDTVDTLRKEEDSFQGLGFKKLLNASGKEDLFGGVQVGITVAMQNALISFAGRTTPAQTGTVTGSPVSPLFGRQIIQDTSAAFITNNVKRGSLIINFNDNSIADVVTVDSETQLTTKTLLNGISNTYSNLDAYHVFNIIQVAANGGNLTAVDGSQVSISPILPTAFTQVVLTASSSATTQNLRSLNHSTFEGHVTIDVVNGSAGTVFPIGTGLEPSDNLSDSKLIATDNGLNQFLVLGDATVGAAIVLDNLTFSGDNPSQSKFTFIAGCSTKKTKLINAELTGVLDGALEIVDCHIEGLAGIGGSGSETNIIRCILETGGITLSTINTQHVHLVDCRTGPPPDTIHIPIDFNGTGGDMTITGFHGDIEILNMANNQFLKVFANSGKIIINASCTLGKIQIFGDIEVIDNSPVGCDVDDFTLSTKLFEVWERLGLDPNAPITNNADGSISVGNITINAVTSGSSVIQTRQ